MQAPRQPASHESQADKPNFDCVFTECVYRHAHRAIFCRQFVRWPLDSGSNQFGHANFLPAESSHWFLRCSERPSISADADFGDETAWFGKEVGAERLSKSTQVRPSTWLQCSGSDEGCLLCLSMGLVRVARSLACRPFSTDRALIARPSSQRSALDEPGR